MSLHPKPILISVACLLGFITTASFAAEKETTPKMDASRDIQTRGWMRPSKKNPSILNIYLEITNIGKEAYLIRGITSASCKSIFGVNFDQDDTEQAAELFTHFTLPSKMTLVFPRGGYHLVCRDFDKNAQLDGTLTLTFKFLEGGEKIIVLKPDDRNGMPAPQSAGTDVVSKGLSTR